ncbi:MAG: glutaredoxin family protein [Dokdonella sp.]
MPKIIGWPLLYAIVPLVALAAGVVAAPHSRALYERMFPEPAYVSGDFLALYRDAGKPVVMFSTSTCPFCKRTREWLASAHADYRDYVVDKSDDAKQRFEKIDGGPVPLLFIGDRRIVGFHEDTLRESLALLKPPTAGSSQAAAQPQAQ